LSLREWFGHALAYFKYLLEAMQGDKEEKRQKGDGHCCKKKKAWCRWGFPVRTQGQNLGRREERRRRRLRGGEEVLPGRTLLRNQSVREMR